MKHKHSYRLLNQSYGRRPISAVVKHPYLPSNQSNAYNIPDSPSSEILLTTPSYSKGYGNNIEKEKLYEQTMQLKTQVNKLTKELSEAKSNNVKLDIELRKRENIIKTIVEENEQDIDLNKKENMEKANESTLVSRCKREYHELKKKYYKLIAQNEFLNTNIKITKINEIKIEVQILQDELIKVTDLYHHSQNQNMSNDKIIKDLIEFKDKFIVQHTIIEDLQKKLEAQHREIEALRQEVSKLNMQKSDIEMKDKKLKIENASLQKQIEKLSNDKKNTEKSVMNQSDYEKKIKELKEKLEQCKKLSPKQSQPYVNPIQVMPSTSQKIKNMQLREFSYDTVRTVETIPDNQLQEKNRLLQGILKDYKIKINIYEAYLRSNNIDPELILKRGNYNSGVINSKSNIDPNSNTDPKTTSDLRQSTQVEDLNTKIINGSQTEVNNIIMQTTNNSNEIENYFYILRKALEAAHVTQEMLHNDLNEIYQNFENKTETTKEEFLLPFVEMFVKHYKLEKQSDINFINSFFANLIEQLDNDTEQFYEKITEMFNKVVDYSNANSAEEQVKLLGKQLYKYKEYLLTSLKAVDQNNSGLIFFQDMWNLLNGNSLGLDSEQVELVFYLMKNNASALKSLFIIDYKVLFSIMPNDDDDDKKKKKKDDDSEFEKDELDHSEVRNKNSDNNIKDNAEPNKNKKKDSESESDSDRKDNSKHNKKNKDNSYSGIDSDRKDISKHNKIQEDSDSMDDSRDDINARTLVGILRVMIYSLKTFDQLFGEYIALGNDQETTETFKVLNSKDFEKVLLAHGLKLSKTALISFQSVYALGEKAEELNAMKIKEDVKNIPIQSLEEKKDNSQFEKKEAEDS